MPLLKKLLEGQALPEEAESLGRTREELTASITPASKAMETLMRALMISQSRGYSAAARLPWCLHKTREPGTHTHSLLQALEAVLKTLLEAYMPAVLSGAQLFQQLGQSRLLPTGCPSIDTGLLRGGLREGQLAEVCGESASGKTQLCLSAAAQTAARGERVVYVDTSNAFSAGRLLGLLRTLSGAAVAVGEALACVSVHRAYDVHAVLSVIDSLLQLQPQGPRPSLVIVDSLSAVIAPVLGGGSGQHSQGHALLAATATSLKALARRLGLVVIVTNHMVGGGEGGRGEKRPAMGESWKNQPHVRLLLCPADATASAAGPQQEAEAGRHVATLKASTFSPPGAQVSYWLAPTGLVAQQPTPAAAAAPGRGDGRSGAPDQ